jgi:heptosyltransferase-3
MAVKHLFIAPTRIGDAVLSTSVMAHIIQQTPHASIHVATSTLSAPLFEGFPQVTHLYAVDKQRYARHWLRIWKQYVGIKWDHVWDFRGSALAYILRTKHRHIFKGSDAPIPKVKQYEQCFHIDALPYPRLHARPEDTARADEKIGGQSDTRPILALAPCANWEGKEWPIDRFITLAQELCAESGYRPMVMCAPHERTRAQTLVRALIPHQPIDLTSGSAPLLTVYACLQRSALFVGNDSGLMHMAAAAAIPTVGVFGPTPHKIYQPYGPRAVSVIAPQGLLADLRVDAVKQAILALS